MDAFNAVFALGACQGVTFLVNLEELIPAIFKIG